MSGVSSLALGGEHPLLESAAGAARALIRTQVGLGAICTELLTVPRAGAVETVRHHHAAHAAHRLARRIADILGLSIQVRGSVPSGPVVLAANHLSYLDPLVIGALLPLAAIAKAELSSWPFLGRIATHVGTLFIRRESPHHGAVVLRQALRRLAAGIPVLNFPEGTTTNGSGPLLPFRRGLFGIARRAGVRVVPVGLRLDPADAAWVGGAAFLPHYWRMSRRTSIRARVHFGDPVDAGTFTSSDASAMEVRSRVERLVAGAR